MRIVAISDTHGSHHKLTVPEGDVLIHSGDFMSSGGYLSEVTNFANWLWELPHKYKIVVAGNHDILAERSPGIVSNELLSRNIEYLCDSGVELDGIRFWGSPYQPEFLNWAFNEPRGAALKRHWDLIPEDTDVLITHGPPYGTLDTIQTGDENLGCEDLKDAVARIKPKLHVFGHIHGGYGTSLHLINHRDHAELRTTFVNAAVMNEAYEVVNAPVVIDI